MRRERGAVTVIVALLFTGMVAFSALALSVDIGNAMVERRAIQNGADAAAMALGQVCAKGQSGCSSTPSTALTQLASANAAVGYSNDAATAIREICGHSVPGFPECGAGDYSKLAKCLPASTGAKNAKYVEVYTKTQTSDGGSVLPKVFSRFLTGGNADISVDACARAAWWAAGDTGVTIPMIATRCFYDQATQEGKKLLPAPPYVAPDNTPNSGSWPPVFDGTRGNYAWAIEAHENGKSAGGNQTTCTEKAHNGQTYPGGFSWVDPVTGKCAARFNANGTLSGVGGASPPQPICKKADFDSWLGKEVFIPIASSWTMDGIYVIDGIASFYFAGYENLGGSVGTNGVYKRPDYVCNGCNSSYKYVWGWFTSGVKPVGSASGGTNLGASALAPAG